MGRTTAISWLFMYDSKKLCQISRNIISSIFFFIYNISFLTASVVLCKSKHWQNNLQNQLQRWWLSVMPGCTCILWKTWKCQIPETIMLHRGVRTYLGLGLEIYCDRFARNSPPTLEKCIMSELLPVSSRSHRISTNPSPTSNLLFIIINNLLLNEIQ